MVKTPLFYTEILKNLGGVNFSSFIPVYLFAIRAYINWTINFHLFFLKTEGMAKKLSFKFKILIH